MRRFAVSTIKIRHGATIRHYLHGLAAVICLVGAVCGGYLLATQYLWATTQASKEVRAAETSRDELLCVLNRKCGMATQGGKYVVVESVTYEVAR